MTRTSMARTIAAPLDLVFETVADINNFSRVVPEIIGVEFLSDQRVGVGTRFCETRRMGKREAETVLEVTEYVENEHVRIVSDAGGTIWDTVFSVRPVDDGTELEMVMDAKAYRLVPRLMNPLLRRFIGRAIAQDLDAVKRHCEARSA